MDPRMVAAAHEHHVKLVPLVMNPGFDQPSIHRVLTNPDARARALHSLAALCRDQHLDGIQFDIENVHVRDKDALHLVHARIGGLGAPRRLHAERRRRAAHERRSGPDQLPQMDLRQLARGVRLQSARRHARFHLVHDVRAAHGRIARRTRWAGFRGSKQSLAVRALARRAASENLARDSGVFRLVVSRVRFDQRLTHARRRYLVRARRRRFSRRAASKRCGTTYRKRRLHRGASTTYFSISGWKTHARS